MIEVGKNGQPLEIFELFFLVSYLELASELSSSTNLIFDSKIKYINISEQICTKIELFLSF